MRHFRILSHCGTFRPVPSQFENGNKNAGGKPLSGIGWVGSVGWDRLGGCWWRVRFGGLLRAGTVGCIVYRLCLCLCVYVCV